MAGSIVRVRGRLAESGPPTDITVKEGRVTGIALARGNAYDAGGETTWILPTLVDIQVNGGFGIDLQDPELGVGDVVELNEKLAAHGVSKWVPTLITNGQSAMETQCRTLAEAREHPRVKAAVPGFHMEGPYLSPEDGPRGAHAREHVRPPSLDEFDRLMDASKRRIVYTTVAAGIPGIEEYVRGVVERGVRVSLGHHAGDGDAIARAVDAGATLCTHLGNGLASTIHRHNNPLWPQLAEDRLTASLLADMHHLSEPILKTFIRAKTPKRIILTSDAVHLAGMKPGKYELAGTPVELKKNRKICLSGTDLLAGSAMMLIEGVANAVQYGGMTLAQAVASARDIPARALGFRAGPKAPKEGAWADFVAVTPQGDGPPRIDASFVRGDLHVLAMR